MICQTTSLRSIRKHLISPGTDFHILSISYRGSYQKKGVQSHKVKKITMLLLDLGGAIGLFPDQLFIQNAKMTQKLPNLKRIENSNNANVSSIMQFAAAAICNNANGCCPSEHQPLIFKMSKFNHF